MRLIKLYGRAPGAFTTLNLPLQKSSSNLCGLYCLYLVHYLVKYPFTVLEMHKNCKLLQTTEIDIVRFSTKKLKALFLNTKFYKRGIKVIRLYTPVFFDSRILFTIREKGDQLKRNFIH